MEGIRSVQRAGAVIAAVAQSGSNGARLVDLVTATGLQKTTVHRLIGTLQDMNWLEQEPSTGAFFLGAPMVKFGITALNKHGIVDIANPRLQHLADITGDTVFLSIRNGFESLCLDSVLGSFPIRALTLRAGDSRPLGIGAGSMSLLAWLSDEEIEQTLNSDISGIQFPTGFEEEHLRKAIKETRERGYAINRGKIVPGAIGIGVPIFNNEKIPFAAISVAAIEPRFTEDRIQEIYPLLEKEATGLSADLAEVAPGLTAGSIRRLFSVY